MDRNFSCSFCPQLATRCCLCLPTRTYICDSCLLAHTQKPGNHTLASVFIPLSVTISNWSEYCQKVSAANSVVQCLEALRARIESERSCLDSLLSQVYQEQAKIVYDACVIAQQQAVQFYENLCGEIDRIQSELRNLEVENYAGMSETLQMIVSTRVHFPEDHSVLDVATNMRQVVQVTVRDMHLQQSDCLQTSWQKAGKEVCVCDRCKTVRKVLGVPHTALNLPQQAGQSYIASSGGSSYGEYPQVCYCTCGAQINYGASMCQNCYYQCQNQQWYQPATYNQPLSLSGEYTKGQEQAEITNRPASEAGKRPSTSQQKPISVPLPEVSRLTMKEIANWTCKMCKKRDNCSRDMKCSECGVFNGDQWMCFHCAKHNVQMFDECQKCGMSKVLANYLEKKGIDLSEDRTQWMCKCEQLNSLDRNTCSNCGRRNLVTEAARRGQGKTIGIRKFKKP